MSVIILIFIAVMELNFMEPTMAIFLNSYYDLDQVQVIYVFILMTAFCIIPFNHVLQNVECFKINKEYFDYFDWLFEG